MCIAKHTQLRACQPALDSVSGPVSRRRFVPLGRQDCSARASFDTRPPPARTKAASFRRASTVLTRFPAARSLTFVSDRSRRHLLLERLGPHPQTLSLALRARSGRRRCRYHACVLSSFISAQPLSSQPRVRCPRAKSHAGDLSRLLCARRVLDVAGRGEADVTPRQRWRRSGPQHLDSRVERAGGAVHGRMVERTHPVADVGRPRALRASARREPRRDAPSMGRLLRADRVQPVLRADVRALGLVRVLAGTTADGVGSRRPLRRGRLRLFPVPRESAATRAGPRVAVDAARAARHARIRRHGGAALADRVRRRLVAAGAVKRLLPAVPPDLDRAVAALVRRLAPRAAPGAHAGGGVGGRVDAPRADSVAVPAAFTTRSA